MIIPNQYAAPTEKQPPSSCLNYLSAPFNWAADEMAYGEITPYCIAAFFSLLKALQAVGTNIFGLQETLKKYDVTNKNIILALNIYAAICNGTATAATRVVSNFKSLVRPKFFLCSMQTMDDNPLFLIQTYGRLPLLQETYAFAYEHSLTTNEIKFVLYKANEEGKLIKDNLTLDAQDDINTLANDLYRVESDNDNHARVITLTLEQYKQFSNAKKKKASYSQWSCGVLFLYWFLIIPCALTSIFSSMVAYLAATTLEEKTTFLEKIQLEFALLIVLGNFISYCTFNLTNMSTEVKNTCESSSTGKKTQTDNDTLTHPAIIGMTLFFSIFGTLANIGFAFFSMSNLFKLNDFSKTPFYVKEGFIYANMYCSLFSSIFNFSAKALKLTKKWFESPEWNCSVSSTSLSFIIFSDTCINTLGAFLGTEKITQIIFKPKDSSTETFCLFADALMCASYIFLTFGMARDGSEKAVKWLEQVFCFPSEYKAINTDDNSGDQHIHLLSDSNAPSLYKKPNQSNPVIKNQGCCLC